MKISEAINQLDELKHNTYTQSNKVQWLSRLDAMVKKQIIDTHEGADKDEEIEKYIQDQKKAYEKQVTEYMKIHEVSREEAEKNVEFVEVKYKDAKEHIEATRNDITFTGYDDSTDMNTELLIPAPFDEVYLRWMEAQIDYHNGEYGKYNNSMDMFNTSYNAYQNEYNRTHMPKGKSIRYF